MTAGFPAKSGSGRGPRTETEWTDISGATTDSRTPTADDLGMYLRATVTYQDLFGAGKVAEKVSASSVEAQDGGECTAVICRAGRGRKHE